MSATTSHFFSEYFFSTNLFFFPFHSSPTYSFLETISLLLYLWFYFHACLWGGKRRLGKALACCQEEEHVLGPSFWGVLKTGNLEVVLGKDLNRIFIRFSRCILSGSWLPLIGQYQGRVINHLSWSWHCQTGFSAFLGLELKSTEA